MTIRDWPVQQRPRERLLTLGPQALTDAELLAIFLRTGIRGRSAVQLAQDLITQQGSLARLLHQGLSSLNLRGLGSAKKAQLGAVLEMARRALHQDLQQRDAMNSPQTVRDYLQLLLGHKQHEVFVMLCLDAQHRVISVEELFRGTLTQTSVYPREVIKTALAANAAAVIFAHNHPSGLADPSAADETLTRSLRQALSLVDIRALDHLILAGNHSLSFAERGLM